MASQWRKQPQTPSSHYSFENSQRIDPRDTILPPPPPKTKTRNSTTCTRGKHLSHLPQPTHTFTRTNAVVLSLKDRLGARKALKRVATSAGTLLVITRMLTCTLTKATTTTKGVTKKKLRRVTSVPHQCLAGRHRYGQHSNRHPAVREHDNLVLAIAVQVGHKRQR